MSDPAASARTRVSIAPLYAAGFVTAFGAHSIAAGIGATGESIGLDLLRMGALLAIYDLAEVFLKPVFGSLADRIGAKPVIVFGLLAFGIVSLIGLWSSNTIALAVARLGQGAAASAFSPASSATVARLAAPGTKGRYFGRYGSWKGLGYTLGPLIGAALIFTGGFALLFVCLSAVAVLTAVWVAIALPRIDPLPRPRYTVADLVRQTTERGFLIPTLVLAASTGALGAAIGFLPAMASSEEAPLFASIALASVLALSSTLTQPWAGRLRDSGRVSDRAAMALGLAIITAGILVAAGLPTLPGLYVAAGLLGIGIGLATPFAFAHLADATPPERMGRTMGTAELGRELGDAGGPLLVGGVAVVATLPIGLTAIALVVALTGSATRMLPRIPAESTKATGPNA
ncbi:MULTISPECIES: MFS transporter [unclassified Microbacterium]|uniref:MFS transporter n=1 Tax=unclassified Microbacterium TaxID=2609290 RepID=UPI000CFC29DE|nr:MULTISPECIES: MFS transporter [unclassified Microbacterium]PQZ60268.1 MFS transporter [Microbacterium sp. MYb43]PQZ76918.1 MFS transporter [Microbacterium sp. MYb40]PRB23311.1 MFS transporter [Microbacterium sp. MYb54]PRB28215.1 MFS transporter [Microbacterium sp. MYb50]PRB66266.1 MFS transporter [Microbacterium sp. MYb24]